ncbi:minor head protein (endogenous virus) [Lactococcus phage KSY1]|uniref:Gp065 n=1 Tax=Lactococcus phage KSY1 TaxID=2913972 RepID=A6MAD0_9CAUD|nr:minor head protein [Lactococcus phage KSY1]ABG21608.1 gp065 [Lactococcus phage KSY1]
MPIRLSYDPQKVYVEMPISYQLAGEVTIPVDNTLLIINGPQVLCFNMTGAKITKGYLFENQ